MTRVTQNHLETQEEAMSGVEMIAAERQRQINAEGWTLEHDDAHDCYQLAYAAAAYLNHAYGAGRMLLDPPTYWPWEREWWKPSDDPVRNLEKAGALIAAEIDRLQRERGLTR